MLHREGIGLTINCEYWAEELRQYAKTKGSKMLLCRLELAPPTRKEEWQLHPYEEGQQHHSQEGGTQHRNILLSRWWRVFFLQPFTMGKGGPPAREGGEASAKKRPVPREWKRGGGGGGGGGGVFFMKVDLFHDFVMEGPFFKMVWRERGAPLESPWE